MISLLSPTSRMLYSNGFTKIQQHAFNGTKLDAVYGFDSNFSLDSVQY